jgi:hypothetical protein
MADDAATELAKNITRNVVPFSAGEDIYAVQQAGGNAVQKLLRSLGLLPSPQKTPGMNDPLPRIDPATGEIVWPGEQMQVKPGDVEARRRQMKLQEMYNR